MAIIGCYWDASKLELFIECFDEVTNLYIQAPEHVQGLSQDAYVTSQADRMAVQASLQNLVVSLQTLNHTITKVFFKGPHRTINQGQGRFGRTANMLSITPLADLVASEVDNFSLSHTAMPATNKNAKHPNGKVLRAANALLTIHCSAAFSNRPQKMAICGALEIGNSVKTFKTLANKIIEADLKDRGTYTRQSFKDCQSDVFKKLA